MIATNDAKMQAVTGRSQFKAAGQQIGDWHLLRSFWSLEQYQRLRPEFEDHLPAGAARRSRLVLALVKSADGNRAKLHSRAFGGDSGKYGRTLGADGEPVGRVLDVAAPKHAAALRQDGSPNLKVGEWRVGLVKHGARGQKQALLLVRRETSHFFSRFDSGFASGGLGSASALSSHAVYHMLTSICAPEARHSATNRFPSGVPAPSKALVLSS